MAVGDNVTRGPAIYQPEILSRGLEGLTYMSYVAARSRTGSTAPSSLGGGFGTASVTGSASSLSRQAQANSAHDRYYRGKEKKKHRTPPSSSSCSSFCRLSLCPLCPSHSEPQHLWASCLLPFGFLCQPHTNQAASRFFWQVRASSAAAAALSPI